MQPHPCISVLSTAAFALQLQWQNWVNASYIMWTQLRQAVTSQIPNFLCWINDIVQSLSSCLSRHKKNSQTSWKKYYHTVLIAQALKTDIWAYILVFSFLKKNSIGVYTLFQHFLLFASCRWLPAQAPLGKSKHFPCGDSSSQPHILIQTKSIREGVLYFQLGLRVIKLTSFSLN